MFTTTNTATSAGSAATTAGVCPGFSVMNNTGNHSLVTSSTANPPWRLTSPSVVSIINGNANGVSMPTNGNILYIAASQPCTTVTSNLLQSSQTVRVVAPSFTMINQSQTHIIGQSSNILSSTNNHDLKSGICIDTPTLNPLIPNNGRSVQKQLILTESEPLKQIETTISQPTSAIDELKTSDDSNESEIELSVNNVVCSFASGCKLNLRKIAMEAANVIYKRDQAMVLMKIRNPYCSANVWSSGKVTVTGTTSEDDAQRAARRIARCLQRLGFKVKFRNYRVVNCLATCAMPWPIDIIKLSRSYPHCVSYEPEIHPGATVRLNNKAVLKVFTTGRITLTAPSVEFINTAVNEFYPQLYECRKLSQNHAPS